MLAKKDAKTQIFVWPLSVWERLHGWIFSLFLLIALLLFTAYVREFHLELVGWLLVPQIMYISLVLDTLYLFKPGSEAMANKVAAAWRIVACVSSVLLNVVLFVLLLVLSFRKGHKIKEFREEEGGAYVTLLVLLAVMMLMNVIQMLCYYMGWPFVQKSSYKMVKTNKTAHA